MNVLVLETKFGEPRHDRVMLTRLWFQERGYNVIPFTRKDLVEGVCDSYLEDRENIIVFGSVGVVKEALRRMGAPEPPNLDFPPSLKQYLGRLIRIGTLGEVRRAESQTPGALPVHIKPAYKHKLFTGTLVSKYADLISTAWLGDDEPIIIQQPIRLVSEWRATVLRNEIINVSHYKGIPWLFPCHHIMQMALKEFVDQPIGFGMDWGVTYDGKTVLIEVNDGFALGNYGVRGWQYTAMIECRWRELLGLKDNGVGLGFET